MGGRPRRGVHPRDAGTWNDQSVGAGFQAKHDGVWVDWAYAGYPWQVLAVEYKVGGEAYADYANSNTATATFSVDAEADLSTGTYAASEYIYSGTGHALTQTQGWAADGRVMRVRYAVEATRAALTAYRLTFAVDPDPSFAAATTATTPPPPRTPTVWRPGTTASTPTATTPTRWSTPARPRSGTTTSTRTATATTTT